MLFLTFALLLQTPPQSPAPDQAELQKIKSAMQASHETFCQQARKVNGSLTLYRFDGEQKKVVQRTIVNADKTRYFCIAENGEKRLINAEVYRPFGDQKQSLFIVYNNMAKKPLIEIEQYLKLGEPNALFPNEQARGFAREAPATLALRPLPPRKYTLLDLLDFQAFQVSAIEKLTKNNSPMVKVTFKVDQAINATLPNDKKLTGIKGGWFLFRPEQLWTVDSAEIILLENVRRQPPREVTWKADYVYDPSSTTFPMLKEVRWESAANKDKPDEKPVKQVYETQWKVVEAALPDEQFSLKQLAIAERTADDYNREKAEKLRLEEEEKAKIAALPPEALKPVRESLEISPWVWLIGGFTAFILFLIALFELTSKKRRPTPVPTV
jgi:hypothetical protein